MMVSCLENKNYTSKNLYTGGFQILNKNKKTKKTLSLGYYRYQRFFPNKTSYNIDYYHKFKRESSKHSIIFMNKVETRMIYNTNRIDLQEHFLSFRLL